MSEGVYLGDNECIARSKFNEVVALNHRVFLGFLWGKIFYQWCDCVGVVLLKFYASCFIVVARIYV